MFEVVIPDTEYFDERKLEFICVKGETLQLEHSLLSISKWEAKWEKPFLKRDPMSEEEARDYYRCMTIGKVKNPLVYYSLTTKQIVGINNYINRPMTATTFSSKRSKGSGQQVTSELIYYWMTVHGIPFETEKWHLNRLLTLIQVCNEENAPKKKMKPKDVMSQYKAINEARLKKFKTKG